MGTSSANTGPTGGGWTTLKTRATRFAGSPGTGSGVASAAGIVSALIDALGGPRRAVSESPVGRATAGRVASLVSGLARSGPAATLQDFGLGDLAGRAPSEILAALVDLVAGEGDTLEAAAARQAAAEVLGELVGEIDTWEELEAGGVEASAVTAFLERFLAEYVFQRVMSVVAQRIEAHADPGEVATKEAAVRDYIRGHAGLELSEVDPLTVDWDGPDGRRIIEALFESAYGAFWEEPTEAV